MKRVMKSALVALAMLLVATSAFAVDFSASVVMEGGLWDNTKGFYLSNKGQQDADLLVISVSTDKAGATAQFWSPLIQDEITNLVPGTIVATQSTSFKGDAIVRMRKAAIWFKPVSQLKITIGQVGSGLFTEQLNWYKVPTGASGGSSWQSDAGFGGAGVALEVTPIAGLTINAGVAPGYGNFFQDGRTTTAPADAGFQAALGPNSKFGITAKYKIADIGSAGLGYAFGGVSAIDANGDATAINAQLLRGGMDLTKIPGLYAFLQVIARMDAAAVADVGIDAITIDNYTAYTAGSFTVKAEFPVTIRLTDVATDHSYMSYDVKASYKVLENFSPFLRLTQDGSINAATTTYNRSLDFTDIKFAPKIRLGANYNFGKASFETAFQIELPANDAGETFEANWSIPFNCRVSF